MPKKDTAVSDKVVAEIIHGKKILSLDPVEVSADPKYNGRFTAPSKVDVRNMAGSIRKAGQIQPVVVTKIPDTNDYRMAVGFTRQAAFVYLNENLAEGETPYVMEAVEISGADAAKLLEINVEENVQRKNLTPMDKAHVVKLMDEQGQTDAQIATAMGWKSHASVSTHRGLLTLGPNVQKRIHVGEISADAAFDMVKLQVKEGPEAVAKVVKELAPVESPVDEKTGKATKKIKSSDVKKAVEKKGGFAAGIRKLPELRKLIAAVRNDPTMPSGASYTCALLLMYVEKSKNEGNVFKAFRESCIEDEELRKFLVKKELYGKTQEQREADKAKADAAIAKEKAEKKAEADKAKAKAAAKKAKEKAAA